MANYSAKSILVLVALGLGACSTTPTLKVAQKAPITYKIDQGVFAQASYKTKSTNPYISRTPQAYSVAPQAMIKPAPIPAPKYNTAPRLATKPAPVLPEFDQSQIDKELYAHQRVGKPYKIDGKKYKPKHEPNYDKTGIASWYGPKFHGKLTANGESYDMNGMTAAHKTLPLNSMVFVTNLQTGKSIMVRINDRGPFVEGRIIDLSRAAAEALDLIGHGLAKVRVQYAGPADPNTLPPSAHGKPGKKSAPKPAAPQPSKPELAEEEEMVVEIPKYKPLRDLGVPSAPSSPMANPLSAEPQTPNHVFEAPKMTIEQPKDLPQELLQEPLQGSMPGETQEIPEDGEITLTIKGPVHMAKSENEKARFIPAVNYRSIKSEK